MNTTGYLTETAASNHPPIPKLRFTDAQKFDNDVKNYFESISIRESVLSEADGEPIPGKYQIRWLKPPTMVGLGNYIGCDYRIFQDYESSRFENHPQYSEELFSSLRHTLSCARQICHEFTLNSVFTAKSANGPIFVLKTVHKDHGYTEEININQRTTLEEKEINLAQLSSQELLQLQSIMGKALSAAIEDKRYSEMQEQAEDADLGDECD